MRLSLVLGIHCHQPLGNFPQVFEAAYERAYEPFLRTLHRFPGVRVALHVSGVLLEWLERHHPDWFERVRPLVVEGRIELLAGGCYEPILPILPDHDKVGQIERHLDMLERIFDVRPRGLWVAERVWEPSLARPLARAGIRYTFLDDFHFLQAGLEPGQLSRYFLTEEQGEGVAVFPISQRLRYLIPFRPVEEVLSYLSTLRGGVAVMADDGEKFGVWPGTHTLVYREGWLDRFFEGLLSQNWIDVEPPGKVVERLPPGGTIYLPTASYREMTEWALPVEAGRALARVKTRVEALPDSQEILPWLRGGHWRNFLVKYPEANDLYRRMLRLSQEIGRALASDPTDPALQEARQELWRGQCNDAYWHGIFGGLYLPHLRRAVWQALLRSERLLLQKREGLGPWLRWEEGDQDGDGQMECSVSTESLALTIRPASGGSLSELSVRSVPLNLLDTLTRRPEVYHDQAEIRPAPSPSSPVRTIHESPPERAGLSLDTLWYDRHRRVSLLEALLPPQADLRAWDRGEGTPLVDFGAAHWTLHVKDERENRILLILRSNSQLEQGAVDLEKILDLSAGGRSLGVRYSLRSPSPLEGTFLSHWNLALTAGEAPDRYFELPGRPSLASEGEIWGTRLRLVDEWVGLVVEIAWSSPARIHYAPIYTLSLSEAGFEQIYQGTSLLVGWSVNLVPQARWEETLTLTLTER